MVGPKAPSMVPPPFCAAALRTTITDRTERILAIYARIRSARSFKLTLQCIPFANAAQSAIDARFATPAAAAAIPATVSI